MDSFNFKSLLQSEINNKRKILQDAQKAKEDKKVKYLKVIDIENPVADTDADDDETKETDLENHTDPEHKEAEVEKEEENNNLSEAELKEALRKLGQPIKLFGESYKDRIQRLRNAEAREESVGQRNEFMKTMNKLETKLAVEKIQKEQGVEKGEVKDPLVLVSSMETQLVTKDLLQKKPEKALFLISVFFKRLLNEWSDELESRTDDEKMQAQGKIDMAIYAQSNENIKAFFDRLMKKQLDDDVVKLVTEITNSLQRKEYIDANDAYLRLSIGNAPWPMGVTAVGIHERSASEKIQSNQVAHVLNDEIQRKWIQAIKRLMTFCQRKYPPSGPSKAVG